SNSRCPTRPPETATQRTISSSRRRPASFSTSRTTRSGSRNDSRTRSVYRTRLQVCSRTDFASNTRLHGSSVTTEKEVRSRFTAHAGMGRSRLRYLERPIMAEATTLSSAAPSGRHQRRLRNYLLDAHFQLKYAGILVVVTFVVSGFLGLILWRTSDAVIAQSRESVTVG